MTVLTNSFEGGTNGSSLTAGSGGNTGGSSGSFLDVVNIVTGGTVAFSSTEAAHGSLSAKVATGTTTSSGSYFEWSTSWPSVTTSYGRAYIYMTAAPGSSDAFIQFQSGSGWAGGIQLTTAKQLLIQAETFATVHTMTSTLALNAWFRIEWELVSSATVGQITLNYYASMDSTSATESYTSPATQNFGANCDAVLFGWTGGHASQPATYIDDLGLSSTGFLGPAGSTPVSSSDAFGATATAGETITLTSAEIPGAVSDAGESVAATLSSSDTLGAMAEAGSVSAALASSDTSTGTTAGEVVHVTSADTSTGTTAGEQVHVSGTDAAGAMAEGQFTGLFSADALGAMSEGGSVAAALGSADTSSMADAGVVVGGYLSNNAEGGTSGTTVTAGNSGGVSGNPWDTVFIGSGSTVAFDNTRAAHGSLSYKFATGATTTTNALEWNTSEGTQTTIYFRAYVYLTAAATPAFRFFEARTASGAAHAGSVLVNGTIIQLSYGSGFSGTTAFTTPMPLNQWVRFEGYVTGDPSAGVVSASLFTSMDSETAVESHTFTGLNTGGALGQYWFGQGNSSANSGPFWLDDLAISAAGYVGPVPGPFGANPANSAEGPSSGTTVSASNSGGTAGSPFDAVNIGAGAGLTYDSSQAAQGHQSLKVATGSSSANSLIEWTNQLTGTSLPQVWFRIYLYLTSYSATQNRVVSARSGVTYLGGPALNSAGKVVLLSTTGGTVKTSVSSVPLNQWFRLEGYVLGDPSVGQLECQMFTSSPYETTPDEVVTSTATVNTGSSITRVDMGNPSSVVSYTFWMDELGASSSGYMGPSSTPVYVSDADVSGPEADAGETVQVLGADTSPMADTQAVSPQGADTSTGTTAGEKVSLSSADASTGTTAGEKVRLTAADAFGAMAETQGVGTRVTDADSCLMVDSGFSYISSADTSAMADAQVVSPQGADTSAMTDLELSNWPSDSDTSAMTDSGNWSGSVVDGDTSRLADAGETMGVADVYPGPGGEFSVMTDTYVPGLEVYTYVPLWDIGPGGGLLRLVWGGRVLWQGERPDGAALKLARTLSLGDVRLVDDSDSCQVWDNEETVTGAALVLSEAMLVVLEVTEAPPSFARGANVQVTMTASPAIEIQLDILLAQEL